eukprot:gene4655-8228_t
MSNWLLVLFFVLISFGSNEAKGATRSIGRAFIPKSMRVSSVNGINFNVWQKGVGSFYTQTISANLASIHARVNDLRGKIKTTSLQKIQTSLQKIHEVVSSQTKNIEVKVKNLNKEATDELQNTLSKTQNLIDDVHQKSLDVVRLQVKRLSETVKNSGKIIMDKTAIEITNILNFVEKESKISTSDTKEKVLKIKEKTEKFRHEFFDLTINLIDKTFKITQKQIDQLVHDFDETTVKSYRLFVFLGLFFIITKWLISYWYPINSDNSLKESIKEMMLPHFIVVPISIIFMVIYPSVEYIQIGEIKDVGVLGIIWQYAFVLVIYGTIHFILFLFTKLWKDEKKMEKESLIMEPVVPVKNEIDINTDLFKIEEVNE